MSIRSHYIFGLIIITALLSTSLYLQFYDGFMPCPLCTLQRVTFFFLGILFILGIFLHAQRWGRLIINLFTLCVSSAGILFAGRQVWLQHFPPTDTSECGVSLHYMLQVLPVNEVVRKIFSGSAECTQIGWKFLSLSMAEWTMAWFILFFLLSFYLLMKKNHLK